MWCIHSRHESRHGHHPSQRRTESYLRNATQRKTQFLGKRRQKTSRNHFCWVLGGNTNWSGRWSSYFTFWWREISLGYPLHKDVPRWKRFHNWDSCQPLPLGMHQPRRHGQSQSREPRSQHLWRITRPRQGRRLLNSRWRFIRRTRRSLRSNANVRP